MNQSSKVTSGSKLKNIILQILGFALGLSLFLYYYGIFLPFALALILAFIAAKPITFMQKWLKNWDLSATVFLVVLLLIGIASSLFLGTFINRDFQRLNKSVNVLVSENQNELDAGALKVKSYIQKFYPSENITEDLKKDLESLLQQSDSNSTSSIDFESLGASFDQVKALFKSDPETEKSNSPSFSLIYIIGSTILYFALCLYQIPYFQKLKARYFTPKIASQSAMLWRDFDNSFIRYFKLRTRIILWLMPLYILAFTLLDLPGSFLILIALFFLLYIPYFHYLLLIPIALGCMVLSAENPQSFLFFFSISSGVFVLASLIEEIVLTPRIMEKNIGMNPVIMVLALSFWTFSLGTIGVLLAIPLSSLAIIYFKRYLLPLYTRES
jgi:predicted PurR-regulated permease PerM